jgi:hypothetical protein
MRAASVAAQARLFRVVVWRARKSPLHAARSRCAMFVMRSAIRWADLKPREENLPFLRNRCPRCGDDIRAQQLHAALQRVVCDPDHTVNERCVSFSCVHDGKAFSDLGVLAVIAKAHKMCKDDARSIEGTLTNRLMLVGFWTNEDDDYVHVSGTDFVHVGIHDAVLDELKQRTRSDLEHINADAEKARKKTSFWATAYNEVVYDRTRLPKEAWQMRWDEIPKSEKDKAKKLWDAWKENPDVRNMGFWEESVRSVIAVVMGIGGARSTGGAWYTTELPAASERAPSRRVVVEL